MIVEPTVGDLNHTSIGTVLNLLLGKATRVGAPIVRRDLGACEPSSYYVIQNTLVYVH